MYSFRTASLLVPVILSLALSLAAQQPSSAPEASSRAHKSAQSAKATAPDPGAITAGIYHNAFFGFQYKVPYGWVERTREMREGGAETTKSVVLLAVFERPPEASGDTVNSAVVITAEPVADYPGLKSAADYFGPVTELTTSKGFTVVNEPYEFAVGTAHLVRGDFSKTMGTLTMQQSSLALLTKNYVLSFMIIGGTDDEVNALIERLNFGSSRTAAKPR